MKSFTALNHLEIDTLVQTLRSHLEGATIERLLIPNRSHLQEGFIRGEFVFQLRARRESQFLLWIQLRPQHAVFWATLGQKVRVAPDSTQSAFHQFLNKELRGARVISVRAFPSDRVVEFQFSENRVFILVMIPARPEAIFGIRNANGSVEVLASTQKKRLPGELWQDPVPNPKLPVFTVRPVFLEDRLNQNTKGLAALIEKELASEAVLLRLRKVAQVIRLQATDQEKRRLDALKSIQTAEKENPYQLWGEVLKSHLGAGLALQSEGWDLQNYSTAQIVHIPCDLSLSVSAQVERFYHLARRKDRRLSEAKMRLLEAETKLKHFSTFSLKEEDASPSEDFIQQLQNWERLLGLVTDQGVQRKTDRKVGIGREFLSQEGYVIIAGRNVTENLDLTFKKAKGNDVWLHLRGKRSAHVIVCIPPGKSAPLSTLLDAAQVCLVVSGGREWGKTEVDYTFRKNVKRIKNSTEVNYTQNKTLLVQPDPARINRLFGGEENSV